MRRETEGVAVASLERVFSIDEHEAALAVVLAYADVALREQIKARGYRWDSRRKEWRLGFSGPAQARAEALALRDLGLALRTSQAGNAPLALAETAVRYALPLPFPVAFWGHDDDLGLVMESSSRITYTFVAHADWDGHLLRGSLEHVALGERGRRLHERAARYGDALPLAMDQAAGAGASDGTEQK